MKANFGLLPMPENRMKKAERYHYYSKRALTRMRRFARQRRLAYDRQAAENLMDSATNPASTIEDDRLRSPG
jgi:hypothetical protein